MQTTLESGLWPRRAAKIQGQKRWWEIENDEGIGLANRAALRRAGLANAPYVGVIGQKTGIKCCRSKMEKRHASAEHAHLLQGRMA